MQPIQLDCSVFTEAMDNFALFETDTSLFLDFCQHVFQICIRKRAAAALAYLHNQHGIYIGIMLLGGILPPARTLTMVIVLEYLTLLLLMNGSIEQLERP